MEQYTFQFTPDEVRNIHKQQLKPSYRGLIACLVYVAYLVLLRIFTDLSDVIFGVALGVFVIYILIQVASIVSFRKQAKTSVELVSQREYTYTFSEDSMILSISQNGAPVSEETRAYSEIQRVVDLEGYWLLVILGRSFIVRKADVVPESRLPAVLGPYIRQRKKMQKRLGILLSVALGLLLLSGILVALGTFLQ